MLTLNMVRKVRLLPILSLFSLLLISALTVRADTPVGGPIISDTTWTLANSPYIVVANVEVWEGVTLTIEPGVEVRFDPEKLLQVKGMLVARGTSEARIVFTSNQPNPQPGDWGNIGFTDSSVDATFDANGNYMRGGILQWCVIRYGGSGGVNGAIQTIGASPFISHCCVRDNTSSGIYAMGTADNPVVISDNIVKDNAASMYGGGIYAEFGTVSGNTVSDNSTLATIYSADAYASGGIYASQSTVTGNTVSGNSASATSSTHVDACGGICAPGSAVTGNTVSNNSASATCVGYRCHAYAYGGIGGVVYGLNSTVSRNTVCNNSASASATGWATALGGVGGLAVSPSPYGTVSENIVKNNSASASATDYADAIGGICAYDSVVVGNTVSNNSAFASTTRFEGKAHSGVFAGWSTVTANTVSNNSASADGRAQGGGIYAYSGTVTGNIVSNNSVSAYGGAYGGGIYAEKSTVNGNIVINNTARGRDSWANACGGGIYAYGTVTVTENVVSGNSVEDGGGGIYAYAHGTETVTIAENRVSGNSAGHYGGGIYAESSMVMSNTITANSVSAEGQGSGVHFSGSYDFLNNTVVGNGGLVTETVGGVAIDGRPQFHHNNLYANEPYDVVVLSSYDISGTLNYWGTADNINILDQVYDWYDDTSRGRLLYIPYLQDPDPDAPVPPPQNFVATCVGNTAQLSWDAIPSATTGYGYKVYYDTDASGPPYEGTGLPEGDAPIDVGNATNFTLTWLGGRRLYVTVTAYDTHGRESWYANEVVRSGRTFLPLVGR